MGVCVPMIAGGTNITGDTVGNNKDGTTMKGTAMGIAIGIELDGTIGCNAIGVDLTGGFEIGAELAGTAVFGMSGRTIGAVFTPGLNIGISVLGGIGSIGDGSGETIFKIGGVVGISELGTGDAESS